MLRIRKSKGRGSTVRGAQSVEDEARGVLGNAKNAAWVWAVGARQNGRQSGKHERHDLRRAVEAGLPAHPSALHRVVPTAAVPAHRATAVHRGVALVVAQRTVAVLGGITLRQVTGTAAVRVLGLDLKGLAARASVVDHA